MNPVLLVDDNEELLEVVGAALEGQGFEVELAKNGKEALGVLRRRRPFVILLDLMMPVMNGWEFLHLFRANESLREIPVVVCSAAKVQDLSGVEFLKKPLDISQLLSVVRGHFLSSKILHPSSPH